MSHAKLTIAAAKDYVRGYYASLEERTTCDIEGAGIFDLAGFGPVCRLNVTCQDAHGTDSVQWDVFVEDDGCGGSTLRGEC